MSNVDYCESEVILLKKHNAKLSEQIVVLSQSCTRLLIHKNNEIGSLKTEIAKLKMEDCEVELCRLIGIHTE